MADLIDRQAAIHEIHKQVWLAETAKSALVEKLSALPSAAVQPVRHGHWTLQEDRTKKLYGWHICSECGAWIGEPTNYCSNCGADMRGKQNETD